MTGLEIDKPIAARENEVPDLRKLNDYFIVKAPSLGEVQSITQFPSGYSNLTFCLATIDQEFILRRPPIGANIISAQDMGREFKVLSTL